MKKLFTLVVVVLMVVGAKAFYVAISQWNAFHKLISQMKK